MVLFARNSDMDETMPQTVPSAGFTPPCDYSAFADNFDLSLLPGGDPYSFAPFDPVPAKPKPYSPYYPASPSDVGPDFQTLLVPDDAPADAYPGIYLDVASPAGYPNSPLAALSPGARGLLSPFGGYRHSGEASFYPSSPEYAPSPGSAYSRSPRGGDELLQGRYAKQEAYSPLPSFRSLGVKEEVKEEEASPPPRPGGDHRLLREALEDTSFQKRFNVRPLDLGGFFDGEVKMEEAERAGEQEAVDGEGEEYLLRGCEEGLVQENIEPVLSLAIEQVREDVDSTCATLGISKDPSQWNSSSVLSWIRWTSRQFGLPEPAADQWDMPGPTLAALSEEDFTRRAPQGGMILYAQLEIWKAAYSDDDLRMQWRPETASSNASSGDISEDEEEETPAAAAAAEPAKPAASRSGTHIHLWQFLKELLAGPQAHAACIRWLDRSKGIFKIEDSVKVAKLWGRRKNRPAMNYDKLSRSIRQYYKKGIMKKTERSQRLVYQFCRPYDL